MKTAIAMDDRQERKLLIIRIANILHKSGKIVGRKGA